MPGASPLRFSLQNTKIITEMIGLEEHARADLSYQASCRASCSFVSREELVRSSSSKANSANGPPPASCTRIRQFRVASQRAYRLEAVGREESQVRVGDGGEEVGDQALQGWAVLDDTGRVSQDAVEVTVEKIGSNMRRITAKITVGASLEDVWAILTDYERLADFIPGLAVNELLERRDNGCRLYQVGEQDIALGVKFKAKAVVDCEEKPCEVEPNLVRRDIDFNTVEGDFQIFEGTWRMEQVSGPSTFVPEALGGVQQPRTLLYYILDVQPKMWLPVALVEGRLTSEIKLNLVSIRDRAHDTRPL